MCNGVLLVHSMPGGYIMAICTTTSKTTPTLLTKNRNPDTLPDLVAPPEALSLYKKQLGMTHPLKSQQDSKPTLPAKTRGISNLFSPEEAAAVLGVTVGTLAVWRSTKRVSIPYRKIGRSVKYRPEDLQVYIEQASL
jgi:hypothetical protein